MDSRLVPCPYLPPQFLRELARRKDAAMPPAGPRTQALVDEGDVVELVQHVGDRVPLGLMLQIAEQLLQGDPSGERDAELHVRAAYAGLHASLGPLRAAEGGDTSQWVECLAHLSNGRVEATCTHDLTAHVPFFDEGLQVFGRVIDHVRSQLALLVRPDAQAHLGAVLPHLITTHIGHLTLPEALGVLAHALRHDGQPDAARTADALARDVLALGDAAFPRIHALCADTRRDFAHLGRAIGIWLMPTRT